MSKSRIEYYTQPKRKKRIFNLHIIIINPVGEREEVDEKVKASSEHLARLAIVEDLIDEGYQVKAVFCGNQGQA